MTMMLHQFSLYPLRIEQIDEIFEEALKSIDALGLSYKAGSMSNEL
jgi:hypothetical protein